jgi:prepilin-type N-terminal cleavage/methylation domain-containing protein
MTNQCRLPSTDCQAAAAACAARPIRHSSFVIRRLSPQHPVTSIQHPSAPRRGLTLIELLVTIVIMVTVLAGVLPLVSPNNNSRKIREASRQLNSLLAQAQSQAARDGRPVGIAFREAESGGALNGMAVEAYLIAEPPPFSGFSEFSRVVVGEDPDGLSYGSEGADNIKGNSGELFEATLRRRKLWNLTFMLYGNQEQVPPRMIRIGDAVDVEGNQFLIIDDPDPDGKPNQIDPDTGYVIPTVELRAVWLNENGQQLSPGVKSYSIRRQPVNTSEQPLQFPRGIGIDLEASGADGFGVPNSLDNGGPTTIGIMFSPNGSLDSLYRNNRRMDGVEQVFLLLGLVENGNSAARGYEDFYFATTVDDDELAQRRSRINWLNGDTRWVSVNRAGRIVTAENNISFDPRVAPYTDTNATNERDKAEEQRNNQLNGAAGAPGARQNARNMTASTGR